MDRWSGQQCPTTEDGRDEHNLTGILTPGSASLPPSRPLSRPVAYGEFVTRHSGATVPDFHGVPCHLAVYFSGRTGRPMFSKSDNVVV